MCLKIGLLEKLPSFNKLSLNSANSLNILLNLLELSQLRKYTSFIWNGRPLRILNLIGWP